MKYIVILKQKSYGCDYSIGCGMRFDEVKAESEDELIENVIWPEGRDEHCLLKNEEGISLFMFAPASSFKKVDVDKMLKQIELHEQDEKNAADNNAERAEYERLKRKFG